MYKKTATMSEKGGVGPKTQEAWAQQKHKSKTAAIWGFKHIDQCESFTYSGGFQCTMSFKLKLFATFLKFSKQ